MQANRFFYATLTAAGVFLSASGATAADIVAAWQPGNTDTAKLKSAIALAQPGDTILLGDCDYGAAGSALVCWPRKWALDGTVKAKHGVIYDGTAQGGRSILRLKDFEPHLGEDWDSARWRDIMWLEGAPTDESTVFRNIIFDGNRAGQGYRHYASCADGCLDGEVCRYDQCVPESCHGKTCEPKQEGLGVTASADGQQVVVQGCTFHDHLWVGLLAWHHAQVRVLDVDSFDNHNAIQLGGYHGQTSLHVEGWDSNFDRIPFRGEIEGKLEHGANVQASIRDAALVDPKLWSISFGPKRGSGYGSTLVVQDVETRCQTDPDCRANLVLVPGQASVRIVQSHIGAGRYLGAEGMSLWLQRVENNVSVYDSSLAGYVHIHGVGENFDIARHRIRLHNVELSGAGGIDRYHLGPLPEDLQSFAIYCNRNLNGAGDPMLALALSEVRIADQMAVDGLMHLYGGWATMDRTTFQGNGLPVAMTGRQGDRPLQSTVFQRRQVCRGGSCTEQWYGTQVTNETRILTPEF